jgi:hypothetical protein
VAEQHLPQIRRQVFAERDQGVGEINKRLTRLVCLLLNPECVMCAVAGVKRKAAPEDSTEAVKRTKVDDIHEPSDGTQN